MILKNNFYKILQAQTDADHPVFSLELNSEHEIYKAHFPERPITPGVCIVQIVYELLQEVVKRKMELSVVKNVKFLSVVSPVETPRIDCCFTKITTSEEECLAQVTIKQADITSAKVSLSCSFTD